MRRGRTAGASLAIALAFESMACSSGSDPSTVAADAAAADDGAPNGDAGAPAQPETGSSAGDAEHGAGDAGDGALDAESSLDAAADERPGDGDADASSSALACAMDGEFCTETAGCCTGGVATQCLGGYCTADMK
jgi:hypothetical protein